MADRRDDGDEIDELLAMLIPGSDGAMDHPAAAQEQSAAAQEEVQHEGAQPEGAQPAADRAATAERVAAPDPAATAERLDLPRQGGPVRQPPSALPATDPTPLPQQWPPEQPQQPARQQLLEQQEEQEQQRQLEQQQLRGQEWMEAQRQQTATPLVLDSDAGRALPWGRIALLALAGLAIVAVGAVLGGLLASTTDESSGPSTVEVASATVTSSAAGDAPVGSETSPTTEQVFSGSAPLVVSSGEVDGPVAYGVFTGQQLQLRGRYPSDLIVNRLAAAFGPILGPTNVLLQGEIDSTAVFDPAAYPIYIAGPLVFEPDSLQLSAEATELLDLVPVFLQANPDASITVIADGENDEGGMTLSSQRAEQVQSYWIEQGVDPARISVAIREEMLDHPLSAELERRAEIQLSGVLG